MIRNAKPFFVPFCSPKTLFFTLPKTYLNGEQIDDSILWQAFFVIGRVLKCLYIFTSYAVLALAFEKICLWFPVKKWFIYILCFWQVLLQRFFLGPFNELILPQRSIKLDCKLKNSCFVLICFFKCKNIGCMSMKIPILFQIRKNSFFSYWRTQDHAKWASLITPSDNFSFPEVKPTTSKSQWRKEAYAKGLKKKNVVIVRTRRLVHNTVVG